MMLISWILPLLLFPLQSEPEAAAPAAGQETPVPAEEQDPFRIAKKPVEGEPELSFNDKEAEKSGAILLPRGGYLVTKKHPSSGREIEIVAVHGIALVTQGPIELFGCGEGGKVHESVLRLDADISELNLALSMAKFRNGGVPGAGGNPEVRLGSRVLCFLRWKHEGREVTHRAEDLIINIRKHETMPRVGWTYVAAQMEVPDPSTGGEKKQLILAASATRSVLTTWRDPSTLLDNPLPDAEDDKMYVANSEVLPPPGTPVLVFFRHPSAKEMEEIREIERTYAK